MACDRDVTDPNADATSSNSFILDDGTSGMDLITAHFVCPSPGPVSPAVTVIQGSSVATINLACRGSVSEISIVNRLQTISAITSATTNFVLSSTGTEPVAGDALLSVAANLHTTAKDSAGNTLADVTVVFITDDGSLVKNDLSTSLMFAKTGLTGSTNAVSLVAGGTGKTGDVATVTANAFGKTTTTSVTFAGNAVACDVSAADTTVGTGGSTVITAMFWSDTDRTVPIADYHTVSGKTTGTGVPSIQVVNAVGEGTFLISGVTVPVGGEMTGTLTLGASGGTGVLGTMGGTTTTCNTTVTVSTTMMQPPTPGPGAGDGVIVGTLPASGFGLVTFGGTIDELKAALATACASNAPIYSTDASGNFVPYVGVSVVSAVNAAFNALYPSGLPEGTPLLGGNCGS